MYIIGTNFPDFQDDSGVLTYESGEDGARRLRELQGSWLWHIPTATQVNSVGKSFAFGPGLRWAHLHQPVHSILKHSRLCFVLSWMNCSVETC